MMLQRLVSGLLFSGSNVSMGEAEKPLLFKGAKAGWLPFCLASVLSRDILMCHLSASVSKSLCLTRVNILRRFQKMSRSCRGSRKTLSLHRHSMRQVRHFICVAFPAPHSTLHRLFCTLHILLHTLHSALYSLHSTLYALDFRLYTPHLTTCNLHFTLYAL